MATYFRVLLHGTGILIDTAIGRAPIVGFYATRIVRARSRDEAVATASRVVTHQWRADGAYARNNRGALPSLSAESVKSDTLLGKILFKGGFTFYSDDSES